MYICIYVVLMLITLFLSKKAYKGILNPVTIWATLWSVIGILSNMALFNYYKPSDYVNNVIIIGILIFSLFSMIYAIIHKKNCSKTLKPDDIINNIDIRVFIIINIIAVIIEFPFFIKAVKILIGNGFNLAYLRGVLTDSENGIISGGLISILRDSGVKNVFTLSAIYATILIITNSKYKYKKLIIYIAVIEMIEYSITNAARLYLLNFIIYIVIAIFLLNGKKIISFISENKTIIESLVVLIIFGLILQNLRASDMSILKTLYIYFCSGPSYLTQLLNDSNISIHINQDYYLGTVTLGFISNIYYYLKTAFTGINDSTVKLIASTITIKQYFVGESTYINATCTCFYPFLVDWGNMGVVIGPLISAYITCYFYRKMKIKSDVGSMTICIYVFWAMCYTIFKWNLLNIDFSVIIILNYFICPHMHQKFVLFKLDNNKD